MYDSPTLRGYTFKIPPSKNEVIWEKIIEKHTLANGSIRTYFKGFKPKFILEWEDSWINEDDFSNLCVIYNDTSSTLTFIPRPNTYPATSFDVFIVSDFNFVPHGNTLYSTNQIYEGKIEMEAINVTASCVNWS